MPNQETGVLAHLKRNKGIYLGASVAAALGKGIYSVGKQVSSNSHDIKYLDNRINQINFEKEQEEDLGLKQKTPNLI
jgi:hypothetical protein